MDATQVGSIQLSMRQLPALVREVAVVANRTISQLIIDSTWPCKPNVLVCYVPDKFQ